MSLTALDKSKKFPELLALKIKKMPINSPNNFCFQIDVEPVLTIASNDKFDAIGDILTIAGTDCNTP
jgi:hypothetical protein